MAAKGDPIPTRYDEPEDKLIRDLSADTGIAMAEIVRRAGRLALPKFMSGEANILDFGPPAMKRRNRQRRNGKALAHA